MKFTPYSEPFPFWLGPYTPARGTTTGFRIKNGKLGAVQYDNDLKCLWSAQETTGVQQLEKLVKQHWRGGRILFLPCGYVVKPLQRDEERGTRVVIGEFEGEFLINGGKRQINFSRDNEFVPGSEWFGPESIGLECTLKMNGSLQTSWYRPSDLGDDKHKEKIAEVSKQLVHIFQRTRPGASGGRVHLLIGGHLITKVCIDNLWKKIYIGRIDVSQFHDWARHIGGKNHEHPIPV